MANSSFLFIPDSSFEAARLQRSAPHRRRCFGKLSEGPAKAGNSAKQDAATERWFANSDDIAAFLDGANPKSWPLADGKKMMRDHLTLTTQEVVAHLKKDWAASIASYDEIHTQILHMADMLSSGIEAQFPDKFKA